jgi:hypothetical protein
LTIKEKPAVPGFKIKNHATDQVTKRIIEDAIYKVWT